MQKFQDVILDQYGNVVQFASVIIYNHGTLVKPTIYSDNGSTIAANPLTTDDLGRYYYYAAAGRYDHAISGSKITSYTETDVCLQDSTADLALSTGASKMGFSHANTYAQGTVGNVLNNVIHIKDAPYNAVCDGVTDDTAAILACIAANPGRTIMFSGTPRIKSKLTQGLHQKWISDGGRGTTNSDLPGCYLIKDASFTGGVAVSIRSPDGMDGIGILLENGSTGGGVEMIGHAPGAALVQVVGAGTAGSNGDAFRVGDAAGTNTNSPSLRRCLAYGAGINHGFNFHDGSGGSPNVNYGKAELCEALSVNGDGFRNENANGTAFDTNTAETCVGYGVHVVDGDDVQLNGGDSEANTAGQWQIELAANRPVVDLTPGAVVVDLSETTIRRDLYQSKGTDAQFLITGSTTTAKSITAISRSTTTVTFTIVGHTFIVGDMFAVVGSNSGVLQRFNGGYKVASVVDVDNITATVSSARAAMMLSSQGSVGATAIVGFAASTSAGWWEYTNGIVRFAGHVINGGVAANALMGGNGVLRGLPMPARSASGEQAAITIAISDGVTFPAATLYPLGVITSSGTSIVLAFGKTGAANAVAAIGAGGFSVTSDISFAGSYRAA